MIDGESDNPEPAAPLLEIVDAATPEGLRTQSKRRKRTDDRVGDFWKSVLLDEVGRAEVWKFLIDGGAFTPPFAVGPTGFPQPEATWFKAGQQAFVLGFYHRLMSIDIDGVKLMLGEHDSRFKAAK